MWVGEGGGVAGGGGAVVDGGRGLFPKIFYLYFSMVQIRQRSLILNSRRSSSSQGCRSSEPRRVSELFTHPGVSKLFTHIVVGLLHPQGV